MINMRTPLCPKNHPMNFMTLQQVILVSPEYSNGCSCDWCHEAPTGKFYHCNICNYDICERCVIYGPQTSHHHEAPGVLAVKENPFEEHCYSRIMPNISHPFGPDSYIAKPEEPPRYNFFDQERMR